MLYVDWKIHKKLDEARSIYICPARADGKYLRTLRMYQELMDSGKKLVFVRPEPYSKLRGQRYEPIIVDKDILTLDQCERADEILKMFLSSNLA